MRQRLAFIVLLVVAAFGGYVAAGPVDNACSARRCPPPSTVTAPGETVTVTAPATTTQPPPTTTTTVPSAGELDVYDLTLQPGWLDGADAQTSDYHVLWLYGKSPSTPYRSPDSFKQQTRYLLLDPRYTDADGRAGRDEWWFVIDRSWPASYDPLKHGQWGREANFHNVAGDAGPAGSGGVGWGFGSGVSALALDWNSNETAPSLCVLCAYGSQGGFRFLLPNVTRDSRHTYTVHFVAGRTDGTTVRPGSVQVWADGTLVLDRANINTVQRAQAADGQFYVQRWMVIWDGDYTAHLPAATTTRLALTRVGGTLEQALADTPVVASTNLARLYLAYGTAPKPTIASAGKWAR